MAYTKETTRVVIFSDSETREHARSIRCDALYTPVFTRLIAQAKDRGVLAWNQRSIIEEVTTMDEHMASVTFEPPVSMEVAQAIGISLARAAGLESLHVLSPTAQGESFQQVSSIRVA